MGNIYKPMAGVVARQALNDLGYDVKSDDGLHEAMLGMLVALATEMTFSKAPQNVEEGACWINPVNEKAYQYGNGKWNLINAKE